jgi:hypothetical protein
VFLSFPVDYCLAYTQRVISQLLSPAYHSPCSLIPLTRLFLHELIRKIEPQRPSHRKEISLDSEQEYGILQRDLTLCDTLPGRVSIAFELKVTPCLF